MLGASVAIVGGHSADRTPDGYVTAWTGDLADDVPTQILRPVDERPLRRKWVRPKRQVLKEVLEVLEAVQRNL
jgi:hypothetical protein